MLLQQIKNQTEVTRAKSEGRGRQNMAVIDRVKKGMLKLCLRLWDPADEEIAVQTEVKLLHSRQNSQGHQSLDELSRKEGKERSRKKKNSTCWLLPESVLWPSAYKVQPLSQLLSHLAQKVNFCRSLSLYIPLSVFKKNKNPPSLHPSFDHLSVRGLTVYSTVGQEGSKWGSLDSEGP